MGNELNIVLIKNYARYMTSAIVSTCAMLLALVSTQLLEPQCAVLYVQVIAILEF